MGYTVYWLHHNWLLIVLITAAYSIDGLLLLIFSHSVCMKVTTITNILSGESTIGINDDVWLMAVTSSMARVEAVEDQ